MPIQPINAINLQRMNYQINKSENSNKIQYAKTSKTNNVSYGLANLEKSTLNNASVKKMTILALFTGFFSSIGKTFNFLKEKINEIKKKNLIKNINAEKENLAKMNMSDLIRQELIPSLNKISKKPENVIKKMYIKENLIKSLKKVSVSNKLENYIKRERKLDIKYNKGKISEEKYKEICAKRLLFLQNTNNSKLKDESIDLSNLLLRVKIQISDENAKYKTKLTDKIFNSGQKINDERTTFPVNYSEMTYDEIKNHILCEELTKRYILF